MKLLHITRRTRNEIQAKRRNIGSIISGTMLTSDVLPALLSHIQIQEGLSLDHKGTLREMELRSEHPEYFETQQAEDDLTELGEILNDYAPEGFYFGAHPGDAADYGFWLCAHFVADFDGLKVDDLSEVPAEWSGLVLDVNDHGNMTLYLQAGKSRGEVERVVMWEIV